MPGIKNRQRGKRAEKRIASRLNGRRVGLFGNHDVEIPGFSVEIKLRAKFAALSWLEQAERNCQAGTDPLLIVSLPYQRDPLVVMRLSVWEQWHGRVKSCDARKTILLEIPPTHIQV